MSSSVRPSTPRLGPVILWLAPLGWLWWVLIDDLHVEWSVNPQYGYGWAVPFLCGYLLWQRWRQAGSAPTVSRAVDNIFSPAVAGTLLVLCALLYAPTRLVQEANPGWRLTSWALALEVVGFTLGFLRCIGGRWRAAIFPLAYFLVAVPWPSEVETWVIQGFTRLDAAVTCDLLGWLGIPALPHGNVIEVATGNVGIDEACSGIRSFQATLMISLFLGEFYHLRFLPRIIFCLSGFALSLVFNLIRMGLLVWVAARRGTGEIAHWHDPAGVTILLGSFFGLWALGVWLKPRRQTPEPQTAAQSSSVMPALHLARAPAVALCAWIAITETSVEAWYRLHEARLPRAVAWTVSFPTNNSTFREIAFPERTRQILRYDEGRNGAWREGGLDWQAIFLRWGAGRTALHLVQNHTPEVCMTAAGHAVTVVTPQEWIQFGTARLPFAVYEINDGPARYFIFYSLWDDRTSAQGFETALLDYGQRLAPVREGLRNPGQRSLELTVTGPGDRQQAEAAAREMLPRLIVIKK